MTTARIKEILGGSLDKLQINVSDLCEKHGAIDTIYVSIGGKFNEQFVLFPRPAKITDKKFRANSDYQMLPAFIQYNTDEKKHILVIAIDDFSDPDVLSINRRILETNENANISIILFDKICDKLFLENFVEYFISLCEKNDIDPSNAFICNYVKHANCPNSIEARAEEMIPETIQNALINDTGSDKKFSGCFYQWFGYRFYTYNFIYRYKRHTVYAVFNYTNKLEKLIEDMEIDEKTRKLKSFNDFIENIYDIASIDKQLDLSIYLD